MDRWKSRSGRSQRKKCEVRRSEKRKSQKKEDADARKGRQVAEHFVFPLLCGSGSSKSRLAKAAGVKYEHIPRTPSTQWFSKIRPSFFAASAHTDSARWNLLHKSLRMSGLLCALVPAQESKRWRLDGFYFYLSQRRVCFGPKKTRKTWQTSPVVSLGALDVSFPPSSTVWQLWQQDPGRKLGLQPEERQSWLKKKKSGQSCTFFPSIASWLSQGRSQRECMTRINCNDWVVCKSLHGALVNPIIGLAEDRLHSPVGQSQCHDETPKKQNQPTTKQEQNTSNTKQKPKTKQTKTPETQNRHCEQGQLSGKEISCASWWNHCMVRENKTRHRK